MNNNWLFRFLISVSILSISCQANIDLNNISNDVSIHPDLIVPIGSASVGLGQIIANNDSLDLFVMGNDAEINYLGFDSSEFHIQNINFLENSHQLIRNQLPSQFGLINLLPNTNFPTLSTYDTVKLGINSNKNRDRIDSIKIKSATISVIVDVSSDLISIHPSDMKYTIVFPKGKIRMLDGSSSTLSFSPLGFGMINNIFITNFMMNTSGGESGIPIEIIIDAKSGHLPLTLNQSSTITSKIYFKQLDYSVAYGIFKSKFNLLNTLQQKIDIAKNLPNGSLMFTNPQVCISATTNIGNYLNFQIDFIKAFRSNNVNSNPVYASFNGNKSTDIELKRKPTKPGDTISLILTTLNKEWGRTNELFEKDPKPDILQYNFSATVDSILSSRDKSPSFITSDAKLKVMIKTIIPLNFSKGSYYEFQDSIKNLFLVISKVFNQFPYNKISSTSLIFNLTNGLPAKSTFKFDLIDSIGRILPTTFVKDYLIEAGKVDVNGLVQPGKETKQTVEVTVTKDQLVILRKARILFYKVRIEGNDINSNIHFTKTNRFDLKVGLFVKGEVNATLGTKPQK